MRKELRTEGKPGAPPDKVSVRIPMHKYYLEFLTKIPTKSSEREQRFKNGVQCVVWGFFYVEAFTNFVCELTILRCSRVARVAKDIWVFSERAEIASKIEFLASVHQVDKPTLKRINQTICKLGRMRNRLVHYKDEPTAVDYKRLDRLVTVGPSLHEILEALPDPGIVNAVLSVNVEEWRNEIREVGGWLETLLRILPEDLSNGKLEGQPR